MFKRVLRSRLTYLALLLALLVSGIWFQWWHAQQVKAPSGDLRSPWQQILYDVRN